MPLRWKVNPWPFWQEFDLGIIKVWKRSQQLHMLLKYLNANRLNLPITICDGQDLPNCTYTPSCPTTSKHSGGHWLLSCWDRFRNERRTSGGWVKLKDGTDYHGRGSRFRVGWQWLLASKEISGVSTWGHEKSPRCAYLLRTLASG